MTDQEINKFITEKVMGEKWHKLIGNVCLCGKSHYAPNISYTTDLNALFAGPVEKMRKEGWLLAIHMTEQIAMATFRLSRNKGGRSGIEETLALAICKAIVTVKKGREEK